jgi:hypothetical protein
LIPVYPNTLPRYEGKSKRVIVKELWRELKKS